METAQGEEATSRRHLPALHFGPEGRLLLFLLLAVGPLAPRHVAVALLALAPRQIAVPALAVPALAVAPRLVAVGVEGDGDHAPAVQRQAQGDTGPRADVSQLGGPAAD